MSHSDWASRIPPAALDWVDLLNRHVDATLLDEVVLGGSHAVGDADIVSDTDLFVHVSNAATFVAAEQLRRELLTTSDYLVSTLSYRPDFGVRVRAALSPENSCSFFFFDDPMIRNVGHQRRGIALQVSRKHTRTASDLASAQADHEARMEECIGSLLELPSVLKYLRRSDYCAASLRLHRAIHGLVNVATLNTDDYLAGMDKHLADRLRSVARGFPLDASNCYLGGAALELVVPQLRLFLYLLDVVGCTLGPELVPCQKYISEATTVLTQWLNTNATEAL